MNLLDKDGKPVWYATINVDHVILEFEYSPIGEHPGMESIIRISESTYDAIKSYFELDPDLNITESLQAISDSGRSADFKSWVFDDGIPYKTEFVWFSFDD